MRTLVLILILACGFGTAALWQQQRTQRLRAERALAAQIASGAAEMTPSGLLGEGEAVVVIGRPARATSGDGTAGTAPPPPASAVPPTVFKVDPKVKPPAPTQPPGDFVLEVGAGQSLSTIAHDHYGHAPVELLTKLAKYNGLADANALRAGMKLKLPTLERLGVVLKP